MSAEDRISQYLTTVRSTVTPTAAVERVESVFTELGLPASRQAEGDVWEIPTDVGSITAGLDEDQEILTVWQLIHPIQEPPKKRADYLWALLSMNMSATGAWFAIHEVGEGRSAERWVVIVARLAVPTLDKGDLALALESLFRLSKIYDTE